MFFIRRVSGDSMTPTLSSGQLVVCRKRNKYTSRQVVVAIVKGIEVIKRIEKIAGDRAYLVVEDTKHAHNGEYYAQITTNMIKGVVVWPRIDY